MILMKLVRLSSHDAFKFSPKEFPSCVPKGLSLPDGTTRGLKTRAPGWVTALALRSLGTNFKVAQGLVFSVEELV